MTTLGSENLSSDLLASIGDVVFEDLNGNGFQDPGEPGIAGVTVSLDTNADGTIDATTVTDADGRYEFDGLTPGLQYQVIFERPSGFQFTEPQDPAYGPDSQVLVAFGRIPTGFVTGDFNDDGIPDVITQDEYLPVLGEPLPTASGSLFLGDGTGNFELPFQIDLSSALGEGSAFVSSLAGDFNNDGIDDLAAGIVKVNDGTTVVSLFLSTIDDSSDEVSFTAATTTQPLSGVPTDWVAGDIDGDGNLDLAIANSTSNDISVLFGDGSGGLSAPTIISNYAEADPASVDQALKSIALRDLDQDGIQDLVVGVDFIYPNQAFDERVATFSVLLGDGSGGFGDDPSTITVATLGTQMMKMWAVTWFALLRWPTLTTTGTRM